MEPYIFLRIDFYYHDGYTSLLYLPCYMAADPLQLQEKEFIYSSFRLHEKGISPIGTPTYEEWVACGEYLHMIEKHVHFWIGDWLIYRDQRWGETYTEAQQLTGLKYGTLKNNKYVSSRIELSRRRDNLPFAYHQEVAPLETHQQELLLDKAEEEGLTLQQLRMEKHRLAHEAKRTITPPSVDHGLFLGDCREVLHTIPDNSVDCIITDPPYGLNYISEHKIIEDAPIMNDGLTEALQVLDTSLAIAERKLKDNSHIYIFASWKTYPKMQAIIEKYFTIKNILVWEKNNWTAGDLEANYGQIHEFIIFAHKGRRHLNGRRDSSVLHFPRVAENSVNRHPTEKPVELLSYLVTKSTQEGETVLDMFMGSGSTCVAAKNTNRKYIGIELDEQWYNVATTKLL